MSQQELMHSEAPVATILVVEDDSNIIDLLKELLSGIGYHVLVATTGGEALECIESEVIDLVLLDVMLPDVDGYEVCRGIRQSATKSSLPIVMLTALGQPEDVVVGLRAGANDYLAKPFFPDELLLRIEGALRTRQARQSADDEIDVLRNMLALVQRELSAAQQDSRSESIMRYELLHNVTVHMQSLVAIIESELRRLPPGPSREAVQRIRTRVRGAALVYQVSQALQSEPVIIGDIVNMTASALKAIYRPWKRIVVEVAGGHVELPAAVASALAMAVNELVTNCFKHAFPDNRFGSIQISYGVAESSFWLSVADDGTGCDLAAVGNGRATITQLIQNLGGTIAWSDAGPGTMVRLEVPVPALTQAPQ